MCPRPDYLISGAVMEKSQRFKRERLISMNKTYYKKMNCNHVAILTFNALKYISCKGTEAFKYRTAGFYRQPSYKIRGWT